MHGHNFYVLAYGNGTYVKERDTVLYNTVDPPLGNTVTVMPWGWVAIRFREYASLLYCALQCCSSLYLGSCDMDVQQSSCVPFLNVFSSPLSSFLCS